MCKVVGRPGRERHAVEHREVLEVIRPRVAVLDVVRGDAVRRQVDAEAAVGVDRVRDDLVRRATGDEDAVEAVVGDRVRGGGSVGADVAAVAVQLNTVTVIRNRLLARRRDADSIAEQGRLRVHEDAVVGVSGDDVVDDRRPARAGVHQDPVQRVRHRSVAAGVHADQVVADRRAQVAVVTMIAVAAAVRDDVPVSGRRAADLVALAHPDDDAGIRVAARRARSVEPDVATDEAIAAAGDLDGVLEAVERERLERRRCARSGRARRMTTRP